MIEQLTFLPETAEQKIERRFRDLEEKFEKTRRSLYAKNSELMNLYIQQKYRADTLEAALCRCGLKVNITQSPLTFYSMERNDGKA